MKPDLPLMHKYKSTKGHNQNIESEGGISSASGGYFPHPEKKKNIMIFFFKSFRCHLRSTTL